MTWISSVIGNFLPLEALGIEGKNVPCSLTQSPGNQHDEFIFGNESVKFLFRGIPGNPQHVTKVKGDCENFFSKVAKQN